MSQITLLAAAPIAVQTGTPTGNVVVAGFSYSDAAAPASQFSAIIDWGDGSTSAGTVSGVGGTFAVLGGHSYATKGNYTINVAVTDTHVIVVTPPPVQPPPVTPPPIQPPNVLATVSNTVAASDSATVTDPVVTYPDGSAGAPAGVPQFPNLLSGYKVRPPWKVAAVDYRVGVPQGTALKDPTVATNLPAGCTFSGNTVRVNGTGSVVIDGFDFSRNGGIQIYSPGATSLTVRNSLFGAATAKIVTGLIDCRAGDLTVLNCSFSAAPTSTLNGAIYYTGNGKLTAQYNIFDGLPADAIDISSSGATTSDIRFNYFGVLGTVAGAHPDPMQWVSAKESGTLANYNTVLGSQAGQISNEMFVFHAQAGGTFTNAQMCNNTIIATRGKNPAWYFNIMLAQDATSSINGVMVKDNYLALGDQGGGAFYPIAGPKNVTISGTINMDTGTIIPSPI